jgi:hypothetical protein
VKANIAWRDAQALTFYANNKDQPSPLTKLPATTTHSRFAGLAIFRLSTTIDRRSHVPPRAFNRLFRKNSASWLLGASRLVATRVRRRCTRYPHPSRRSSVRGKFRDARRSAQVLTFCRFDFTTTSEVIVRPYHGEEKRFPVYRDLLTSRSGLLLAARNAKPQEPADLYGEDLEVFSLYLNCIHSGTGQSAQVANFWARQ